MVAMPHMRTSWAATHMIEDEGFIYKVQGLGGFNKMSVTSIHVVEKKQGALLYYHRQHQKIRASTLKKYLSNLYLEFSVFKSCEHQIRHE